MFRPFRAALVLALVCAPLMAQADKIPLSKLSAYLNALTQVETTFTQVDADGRLQTGKLFIHRPGRMRFEYDRNDGVVIAGGQQLAIFDPKGDATPESYPLDLTPLNLILQKRVRLTKPGVVLGHTADDSSTYVVVQDPEHPNYGSIQLVFSDNPVELRQWVIAQNGEVTTVILGPLRRVNDLSAFLFSIPHEIDRRTEQD